MENERRRFHRIKYPDDRRPKMFIRQKGKLRKYEVADISGKGIGLVGKNLRGLRAKLRIEAKIIFSDGILLAVEGKVLRVSENNAGIYVAKGIPFYRITKEQILLRD